MDRKPAKRAVTRVYSTKKSHTATQKSTSKFDEILDPKVTEDNSQLFSTSSTRHTSPDTEEKHSNRKKVKDSKKGGMKKAKMPKPKVKKQQACTKKVINEVKPQSKDLTMFGDDSTEAGKNIKENVEKRSMEITPERDDKKDQTAVQPAEVLLDSNVEPVPTEMSGDRVRKTKDPVIKTKKKITEVCKKIVSSTDDPLAKQMAITDKVNEWFARSEKSPVDKNASIETFREEIHHTGKEHRQQLFPDSFYAKLGQMAKPKVPPLKADKNKKSAFLSQLKLSPTDPLTVKARSAIPIQSSVNTAAEPSSEDLTAGTELETDTDFQTNTDPLSSLKPSSNGETALEFVSGTITEHKTISVDSSNIQGKSSLRSTGQDGPVLSSIVTGTDTQDRDGTTGLGTSGQETLVSRSMVLPQTNQENTTDSMRSSLKCAEFAVPKKASDVKVSRDGTRAKMKGYTSDFFTTTFQENSIAEARVQNYLSSTARPRTEGHLPDFPSEVSAIKGSLQRQKNNHKTPQTKHAFVMPGSPIKSAEMRVAKKGQLMPKNSTQLFTTGFVEISDVFPQMSSIRLEPSQSGNNESEKFSSAETRNAVIKTSTPTRTGQKRKFSFEIDLSSVRMESDDDGEGLQFHESIEVNSEEILHVSQSWIDPSHQPLPPLPDHLPGTGSLGINNQKKKKETKAKVKKLVKQRKANIRKDSHTETDIKSQDVYMDDEVMQSFLGIAKKSTLIINKKNQQSVDRLGEIKSLKKKAVSQTKTINSHYGNRSKGSAEDVPDVMELSTGSRRRHTVVGMDICDKVEPTRNIPVCDLCEEFVCKTWNIKALQFVDDSIKNWSSFPLDDLL